VLHISTMTPRLPVNQHIHFKIANLTYRTLRSGSPSYLSSLINFNNPPRPLSSSSLNLLHIPFTAKAIDCKAFRFTAATVWNSIPQNIRLLPSAGSQNSTLFLTWLAMSPPRYSSASDSSLLEFVRSIIIIIIIIIMTIIIIPCSLAVEEGKACKAS